MAQRRMISKSISTSKRLSALSTFEALLFTWTIPHCDDYGRMDGNAKIVKGIVMPLRDETIEEVESALKILTKKQLIERYTVDEEEYLQITKWDDHQTFKTDRNRMAKYPENPTGSILEPTGNHLETNRKICPPKLSEVKISEVKGSEDKVTYGEFQNVLLKPEEYQKLVEKVGEKYTKQLIEELSTYLESKGGKYRSHYATLLNWARRKYADHMKQVVRNYKGKQVE